MVDKGRLRRSWRDGGVSATRYERACPDAVKSSRDEDIKMHVDYWHGEDGVDVKGNNLPDEIWVEFKNVRGDAGWLLGKAKWIAFEMCEVGGYVRVEREELLEWCKKNVDFSKKVWKKDAYRKIYQRKDRQDQITLLALHDLREIKKMMMSLKGTVAGRFLWQLGTKTVDKLGLPSLQNCAFTVVDEPIRPFTWAFEMLMLGSGVGYNIQREHVYQLPKVRRKVKIENVNDNGADFIVPDSREGWTELLKRVLEASFVTGEGFTYATHLIRPAGSKIEGFGGTASGSKDLIWGMQEINNILNNRSNKRLQPIDCLDIMNIIGKIVVAGNVRRSAQIALGDHDDLEYLRAKRWDLGGIPNWRAMSNNSVVCDDIDQLPDEFWEGYKGNGEPYGLINLESSRRMGRTGEEQYPDPDVMGYNPCAEQSLAPYETCCLAEIYLPNIDSFTMKNLNKQLIEEGHAVEYYGGKR